MTSASPERPTGSAPAPSTPPPSTPLPSTSLPSTSLPSTPLPSTSLPSPLSIPAARPGDQVLQFLLNSQPTTVIARFLAEAYRASPPATADALAAIRRSLCTGYRLGTSSHEAIARIVALAEERDPGWLADTLAPDALARLCTALTGSPSYPRLAGYASAWDGVQRAARRQAADIVPARQKYDGETRYAVARGIADYNLFTTYSKIGG